ncbi:MAG: IS110 family transposase [Pseudomonadota bacterium]
MEQPITIGLDLAKSVFQVHGVGADGATVVRRQLRRSQLLAFFEKLEPCLVGMEASAGAHHWAREFGRLGHEVKLMPPAYVKPYVKRGKTDAADAEAICEAVTRPTMRFVPVKSAEHQAALLDYKARDFLVRQRTQTVNAIRAHLSEFGIVVAKGIHNVDRLLEAARDLPEAACPALNLLADQLRELEERIEAATARIAANQKANPLARRLATIPGLGPIASSAFAATTPDIAAFRSARDYAAWLGLTPRAHSSGSKERRAVRLSDGSRSGPHRISKAGNRYLRRLLYLGAMARPSARRGRQVVPGDQASDWLDRMLARKPVKVVAVALAARMARTVWALIAHGGSYRAVPG